MRAGAERRLERRVASEVEQADAIEQLGDPRRPEDQDVVRTGITTWMYWSSPIGLKTPGDSGPLSSSANWSASTLVRTSAR